MRQVPMLGGAWGGGPGLFREVREQADYAKDLANQTSKEAES